MRTSSRLTVQTRCWMGAIVAVMLVTLIETNASTWGYFDGGGSSHVESWAPHTRGAVGGAGDSLLLDSRQYNIPAAPTEGVSTSGGSHLWGGRADGAVASSLTVEDLPIDAGSSRRQSAVRGQKNRKRPLASVIANFFRKPHLIKIGIFLISLALAAVVVGFLAKIGLVLFSVWLAFKALQYIESRYDLS